MISTELARALRDSGLVWTPRAGDAFRIDRVEADEEIYVLSDMTVEAHDFSTGTVIGFNGTTEWALDSVDLSATRSGCRTSTSCATRSARDSAASPTRVPSSPSRPSSTARCVLSPRMTRPTPTPAPCS